MKKEIYQEVVGMVSTVTGISVSDILRSKREECTDARWLIVRALHKLQYSNAEVATAMGCTRQNVGYMLSHYKKQGKWQLEKDCQTIVKWIENNFFN